MNFTDQLRKENDDVFELIFRHPFVEGIGKGDIAKEAITHYVKADFEYLNAFMRIYGMALAKSTSREEIGFFHEKISFVLYDESHPHHNFCDYIGVGYEELQGHPLPPTADHYIKHMMYHAHSGTLGEILAALLPCPWTYLEIGKELMKKYNPTKEHPFYSWISFYADDTVEKITLELRELLDNYMKHSSPVEIVRVQDAFRKSCQLEWKFWEMAFTCEEWPSKKKVLAGE